LIHAASPETKRRQALSRRALSSSPGNLASRNLVRQVQNALDMALPRVEVW
jgi:hypothetical protein